MDQQHFVTKERTPIVEDPALVPFENFSIHHCNDTNEGHHVLLWKNGNLSIDEAVYFVEYLDDMWDRGNSYNAAHFDHSMARIYAFVLIGNATRFQQQDANDIDNIVGYVDNVAKKFLKDGFERDQDLTNEILSERIDQEAKWFIYPYQDLQNGSMTLNDESPQGQALLNMIEKGNGNLIQQIRVILATVMNYIRDVWRTDPSNSNSEVMQLFQEYLASLEKRIEKCNRMSKHLSSIHGSPHTSCDVLFDMKQRLPSLHWVIFKRVCNYPDMNLFFHLPQTPITDFFKTFRNQHSIRELANWCRGCFIENDLVEILQTLSSWINMPTREFAFDFELFIVYNFSCCFFRNRGLLFLTGSEVYSLMIKVLDRMKKMIACATRDVIPEHVELVKNMCSCYVMFLETAFPDMPNIIQRFRSIDVTKK